MDRTAQRRLATAGTGLAVVAAAFAAAPRSCDGGLEFYVVFGAGALLLLFALPFLLDRDAPAWQRLLRGVGGALLGAALWCAGLFAANVRIICRLF
jgi:hypothetical protein